jgi:hypothetical protein
MNTPTLSPAELHILERLGGRRWTVKRFTPEAVKAAKQEWKATHNAVGFATSRWMTTDETNPKLGKSGLPTLGITIHSARHALAAWKATDLLVRHDLATAVGSTVLGVERVLRHTVCPMSTKGCRGGCVTAESVNALNERSQRARLARHVFLMFRPASAFALTADHLDRACEKYGRRGARYRVNVSDDIRFELLAPGLFSVAPRPYAYTKWTPEQRPGRPGFRLVYSGSERTSDQEIVDMCSAGLRVAVVLDVPKSKPLPATWHGITVIDGDKTDDLWQHSEGVIVGLRSKGRLDMRASMLASGFAKPAMPIALESVDAVAWSPVAGNPVQALAA